MEDPQNQTDHKPELFLDRPADRTLEAFKISINEMFGALGSGESQGVLTEEQWVDAWEKFWKD